MLLRRLLPSLVVLTGGICLAFLGNGWVERDRDARTGAAEDAVLDEARSLARGGEAALARVTPQLREGAVGTRVFLTVLDSGMPRVLPRRPDPINGAERALLEQALEVGNRLRAAGEPLRAIDAYTYLLPRVTDLRVRARLRFAAATTALETETMRAFGITVLEDLAGTPVEAPPRGMSAMDNGEIEVPIDLMARLALADPALRREPGDEAPTITALDLLARLDDLLPAQARGLAARFSANASAEWEDDPRLAEAIARREEAIALVGEQGKRLQRGEPTLASGWLLVPLEASVDGAAIDIAFAPVAALLPSPPSGLEVAWEAPGASEAVVSIEGTPVASVTIDDPDLPARLQSIHVRAASLRWLLFAVLAVIGIAVVATWHALDRQRRLATLRMRLLANVSHELKTPVTSIRMLGELLEQESLPAERVQEFGKLIMRESERLGTRIEEILETARSERDRTPLSRAPVALPEVLEEVVGQFEARVDEVGGSLSLECSEGLATLETHRDALERIVENLVDNALKYGAREGAKEGPQISVTAAKASAMARVVVEDDGPGIPSGERGRIFEPFYRAEYDDFAVAGTGLGLSISRSFAERLGGSLDHSPRPGGGSRFTLTLPLRVSESPDPASANGATP